MEISWSQNNNYFEAMPRILGLYKYLQFEPLKTELCSSSREYVCRRQYYVAINEWLKIRRENE